MTKRIVFTPAQGELHPRKIAQQNGDLYYTTGLPCTFGHIGPRITKDGYCLGCRKERDIARMSCDKRKLQMSESKKRFQKTEKHFEYQRKWCKENPEKVTAKAKRFYESGNYRAYHRAYEKRQLANNPLYKARHKCRQLLMVCLKKTKMNKNGGTNSMLGYTAEQLLKRIEFQFRPGMSWLNHGEWEVDHKKPIARFLRQGITDPRIINALSNLQPLWREENRIKSDTFWKD